MKKLNLTLRSCTLYLTIALIIGTTAFYGQTDSAKICLKPVEFRFYAEKLIRFNGLVRDTAALNAEIQELSLALSLSFNNLTDCRAINATKEAALSEYKAAFANLQDQSRKLRKRAKLAKIGCISFGGLAAILAAGILIK